MVLNYLAVPSVSGPVVYTYIPNLLSQRQMLTVIYGVLQNAPLVINPNILGFHHVHGKSKSPHGFCFFTHSEILVVFQLLSHVLPSMGNCCEPI
jgi:hypothetical protein